MIYSNRYEVDILLREILDKMLLDHKKQLKLHYILSQPPENWPCFSGRVNCDLISKLVPKGDSYSYALICGPPGFVDQSCIPSLLLHGFDESRIVQF
jgi:cytochrome-b5 reductase